MTHVYVITPIPCNNCHFEFRIFCVEFLDFSLYFITENFIASSSLSTIAASRLVAVHSTRRSEAFVATEHLYFHSAIQLKYAVCDLLKLLTVLSLISRFPLLLVSPTNRNWH